VRGVRHSEGAGAAQDGSRMEIGRGMLATGQELGRTVCDRSGRRRADQPSRREEGRGNAALV
jgi:hypothetical protein